MTTREGLDAGSFIPTTKVRTTIPMTSSMIAALMIVVPVSDLRYPSSWREATEMLTEVAVMITPVKIAE